jgi:hypothetical protein
MRSKTAQWPTTEALQWRGMRAALTKAVVIGLVLPLLLTACRGAPDTGDPSLVLEVAISPTPPAVGSARLIINLRDTAGVPLEGAEVRVEGNMSHAGMVPVLATAQEEAPGIYAVSDFRFTMAGDWILTTRATLPDGRWAQAMTTTQAVSAPPGLEPDTAHEGHEHGADHGEAHDQGADSHHGEAHEHGTDHEHGEAHEHGTDHEHGGAHEHAVPSTAPGQTP